MHGVKQIGSLYIICSLVHLARSTGRGVTKVNILFTENEPSKLGILFKWSDKIYIQLFVLPLPTLISTSKSNKKKYTFFAPLLRKNICFCCFAQWDEGDQNSKKEPIFKNKCEQYTQNCWGWSSNIHILCPFNTRLTRKLLLTNACWWNVNFKLMLSGAQWSGIYS